MKALIFVVAESLLLFTVRSMGYPLMQQNNPIYSTLQIGMREDDTSL